MFSDFWYSASENIMCVYECSHPALWMHDNTPWMPAWHITDVVLIESVTKKITEKKHAQIYTADIYTIGNGLQISSMSDTDGTRVLNKSTPQSVEHSHPDWLSNFKSHFTAM